METRYLYEFSVLANKLSFHEAADALYISQSALSKHIKSLEKELGVELFNRTTRTIELSKAGGLFLEYAKEISALDAAASVALSAFKKERQRTIVLGVQTPQYYDWMTYFTGFEKEHPDISFNIIEADEATLIGMYRNHQFNIFGSLKPTVDKEDYSFLPLVRSEICAILPKEHPLASKESLHPEDLAGARILLPSRSSTLSKIILAALNRHKIVPSIAYEGTTTGSLQMLKHVNGIALHSREFTRSIPQDEKLCVLPFEPAISFCYGVGSRAMSKLSEAEKAYLHYLEPLALPEENASVSKQRRTRFFRC